MNRHTTGQCPMKTICVRAVRHGLTLAIPFLVMGSFALLLNNFPSAVYQDLLSRLLGGAVSTLFSTLYEISLGSLSLVLCITCLLYTSDSDRSVQSGNPGNVHPGNVPVRRNPVQKLPWLSFRQQPSSAAAYNVPEPGRRSPY